MNPSGASGIAFAFALLAALGAGCESLRDLEGRESSTFIYGGGLSYEPRSGPRSIADAVQRAAGGDLDDDDDDDATRSSGGFLDRKPVEGTYAVDLDVRHVEKSEFNTVVPPGDAIDLPRFDVNGPAIVHTDIDLTSVDLTSRGGVRIFELFSIEGRGGLGYTHSNKELSSTAAGKTLRDWSLGGVVGARGEFEPFPGLIAYADGRLYLGFSDTMGYATRVVSELGVEIRPAAGFALFGGWHRDVYREERGNDSDVEVEFRGVMGGLRWVF